MKKSVQESSSVLVQNFSRTSRVENSIIRDFLITCMWLCACMDQCTARARPEAPTGPLAGLRPVSPHFPWPGQCLRPGNPVPEILNCLQEVFSLIFQVNENNNKKSEVQSHYGDIKRYDKKVTALRKPSHRLKKQKTSAPR